MSTNGDLNRKLRMALVGGGAGSFIGRVHCTAAVLDNRAALVAGALSLIRNELRLLQQLTILVKAEPTDRIRNCSNRSGTS